MNKSKLAKILDGIFIISGTFALSFCLLRYYVTSLILLIIISLFISIAALSLVGIIFKDKHSVKKMRKDCSIFFEKLMFTDEAEELIKLNDLIQQKHESRIESNLIISDKSAFCISFRERCSVQILAKFYTEATKARMKKLIILCSEAHPKAKNYADKLNDMKIIILEGAECYRFLKWLNFPTPNINITKEKKGFMKNFGGILAPDKSPRYFSLFIFFLAFSFFVQYSIYYIICASLMLILSIIAKSNIIAKLKK